jgi:hypothetical protein
LVHVHKGIKIGLFDAGKGPSHGETFTFEPFGCGGDQFYGSGTISGERDDDLG